MTTDEPLSWAWVCDHCKVKSLGAGPMKCWLCGRDMFEATLADFRAAKGSWTSPRRKHILAGEDLYPLEHFWICNGCEAIVISSARPQCWPCRESMRNLTYQELVKWRDKVCFS